MKYLSLEPVILTQDSETWKLTYNEKMKTSWSQWVSHIEKGTCVFIYSPQEQRPSSPELVIPHLIMGWCPSVSRNHRKQEFWMYGLCEVIQNFPTNSESSL